jgi:3D-(3,5/4)-trihydroxycyclohexane-1,2-dione acylhydrolase (decyclizing)
MKLSGSGGLKFKTLPLMRKSHGGNYATEHADLLIAIGTRGVCQADCSGIGYPNARAVININGDLDDLAHYANTIGLPGDVGSVTRALIDRAKVSNRIDLAQRSDWLAGCRAKKAEWQAFKAERLACPPLPDAAWGRPVLTQPVAIHRAASLANQIGAVKYFDAGDVQANGFQIVVDDRSGQTFTESGASYMGFAVSALLASAVADRPRYGFAFTGDGSFMMNPQILIDAVQHGAKGCIVLFDNRRMAAITGLQEAQYGREFATNDRVTVDYVQLAQAVEGVHAIYGGETQEELDEALGSAVAYDGLSLVHVPVCWGDDPRGGMGSYGSWNVGNWVADVQAKYLRQYV